MGCDQGNDITSKRVTAAWLNRHGLAVCIVAAMIVIDTLWCNLTGHSVPVSDLVMPLKGAVFLACVAAGFRGAAYIPRYHAITKTLRFRELADITTWMLLLGLYMLSGSILSYLCATTHASLVSPTLQQFDVLLGFDWPGIYRWVQVHSTVHDVLRTAYLSGAWQLYLVPISVGLIGRRRDMSDFVLLFMLSGLFVMVVSAAFPAESAFVHFGIADPGTASTVSDFKLLRDGTLRVFDLHHMQGIVSMPSFHTMLAIFFIYVLRNTPFLFAIALPLDLVLIASTPTQGGHYLADVLGGLLASALSIWMLRSMTARCDNRRATPASPSAGIPDRRHGDTGNQVTTQVSPLTAIAAAIKLAR